MGLDTSHDCWHGPYSAFHDWRRWLAKQVGIDLDRMERFGGNVAWGSLEPDIIHVLLNHSDCDGEIPAGACGPLAQRLEQVFVQSCARRAPLWEHGKLSQFINGLWLAHRQGESVEFH